MVTGDIWGARCKKLFKGIFSYSNELFILYAHAFTEKQAWLVFCRRLAKKHDVAPRIVMSLFDGSRANYEISIETQFQQIEEMEGKDEKE